MKTVFIFGAGASKQAGAPLMSNFMDVAERLYRTGVVGAADDREAFADVFKAVSDMRAIHQKAYLNLDNFETLFGAIEMANLTGKLASRTPESIKKLRDSLVTLIVKTLEYSIPFPRSSRKIVPPPPYDYFATSLVEVREKFRGNHPGMAFLTFNYDLALDYMLHYMGRWGHYDYCLSGQPDLNKIPLLKLHGSINWSACEECGEIVPFNFSELDFRFLMYDFEDGPSYHYFDLGTNIHRKQHHGKPLKSTPVLVPPTWNKTGYHENLAPIWGRAARELAEAENIYVIGYSLPETDSFFRYLYALGSESETRIKRFWVFNPDNDGTVERRFREMVGRGIENRFRFIKEPFDAAIDSIRNELLEG